MHHPVLLHVDRKGWADLAPRDKRSLKTCSKMMGGGRWGGVGEGAGGRNPSTISRWTDV